MPGRMVLGVCPRSIDPRLERAVQRFWARLTFSSLGAQAHWVRRRGGHVRLNADRAPAKGGVPGSPGLGQVAQVALCPAQDVRTGGVGSRFSALLDASRARSTRSARTSLGRAPALGPALPACRVDETEPHAAAKLCPLCSSSHLLSPHSRSLVLSLSFPFG